jgi:heterodisulfide reductase subunit A-like polyferredoxin
VTFVTLVHRSATKTRLKLLFQTTNHMKQQIGSKSHYLAERAIVAGSGIGGLSAARALSGRFRQVLILDRDELPGGATPRPGVPQGKQPHGLLSGGLNALEHLFPGFGN